MEKSALILGAALSLGGCKHTQEPQIQADQPTKQRIEACKIEKKTIFNLCSIESMKETEECDDVPQSINALGITRGICQNGIERLEKTCHGATNDPQEFINEGNRLLHRIERRIIQVRKAINPLCTGDEYEAVRREDANKFLEEMGLPPVEKPEPKDTKDTLVNIAE